MSLEAKLEELIEAVKANTEALQGAGASTGGEKKGTEGTSGKGTTGKGATGKGAKFTEEQVKAMAVKIKDKFGTGEAKKLIKAAGKADQLSEMEEGNFAAFMKAAEAKLKAAEEADNGDNGDEGDGL